MTTRVKPNDSKAERAQGLRLWALSDGTAGMHAQCVALANALKRHRAASSITEFKLSPHPLLRTLPWLGAWLPILPLYAATTPDTGAGNATTTPPPQGEFPDILITCGRRVAGLGLALCRRARKAGVQIQHVHLQDPRIPPSLFDALIVPQHDPARGPNVITSTGALNRLTPDMLRREMMDLPSRWLVRDTTPTVVVMLGGDNRRYKISEEMMDRLARQLQTFAASEPMRIVLLASRRSPDGLVERLSTALADSVVMLVAPDEPNPYPGILGLADAVIVTSDSVNMASEATITGKPVLIAGWRNPSRGSPTGEKGRIAAFHKSMMAAQHTAPLGAELPRKRFTALDEMDDICTRLLDILGR
jgi:mitochondrial fission protein ELM1